MRLSLKKLQLIVMVLNCILISGLSGCASNKKEINVVIPPPTSTFSEKKTDTEVSISFRQKDGQVITKTVEAEGRYTGGEDASLSDVRKKAIQAMVNRAVDQVNGQMISNSIEIRQATYGSGSIEETRQDVISQTVGLGRLIQEPECYRDQRSQITTTMVCKGLVSVPLIDELKVLNRAND